MRKEPRIRLSKAKARSAITNGRALLAGVDGRSRAARRYRDLVAHYTRQTGGRSEELVRQLASLILQRELLDAQAVRGEPVDALHLVRLCNSISRTLSRLKIASKDTEAERTRRKREDEEAGLTV
jgi:hypothetical protein